MDQIDSERTYDFHIVSLSVSWRDAFTLKERQDSSCSLSYFCVWLKTDDWHWYSAASGYLRTSWRRLQAIPKAKQTCFAFLAW